MKQVTVFAPATVANVVCGFDVLGFALNAPNDEMTLRIIGEKTVRIINCDDYNLPTEPTKNVAGGALLSMLAAIDENLGFEVRITKNIKPGSGIGSSAASAAGAVVAANYLLDKRFSKLELVDFAMDGEKIAGGARHADNVAPCIYGGFTLVRTQHPLDIIQLDFPPLYVTVAHPQIEVKTSDAREILKQKVELKDAIAQWGNVAALVAGLQKGDYDLISRALEDKIVEPVRSILIPRFDEIKTASKRAGALGGGISGSGPSVFMLSESLPTARRVENAIREIYAQTAIDFNIYISEIHAEGVKIKTKPRA